MMTMKSIRKQLDLSYSQIKLNVIANLIRLLVDIYGLPKAKENLKKVEGEEIVVSFPALNGSIVVKPHGGRAIAEVGDSETAIAKIKINVKDEKIYDVIEDIITLFINDLGRLTLYMTSECLTCSA